MSKPSLSCKLNVLGTIVLGSIAVIGITTEPVYAVSGRLGFGDNTTDFFFGPPEIFDIGDNVNDFNVTFNVPADPGDPVVASVFNASGDFAPLFDPIDEYDVTSPTGNFANGTILGVDSNLNPIYEYTLQNNVVINFPNTDVPGTTATYTLAAGSVFLGEYSVNVFGDIGGLEFELETDGGSLLAVNDDSDVVIANDFEFEDLAIPDGTGEYLVDATVPGTAVPEPTTILGLLTVGGLGLGLRRKKQL